VSARGFLTRSRHPHATQHTPRNFTMNLPSAQVVPAAAARASPLRARRASLRSQAGLAQAQAEAEAPEPLYGELEAAPNEVDAASALFPSKAAFRAEVKRLRAEERGAPGVDVRAIEEEAAAAPADEREEMLAKLGDKGGAMRRGGARAVQKEARDAARVALRLGKRGAAASGGALAGPLAAQELAEQPLQPPLGPSRRGGRAEPGDNAVEAARALPVLGHAGARRIRSNFAAESANP
jgi:hypothetical protein